MANRAEARAWMAGRRSDRPHWLFRPLFRFQGAPSSRCRCRRCSTHSCKQGCRSRSCRC